MILQNTKNKGCIKNLSCLYFFLVRRTNF